jgi:twitching motility protein PilT
MNFKNLLAEAVSRGASDLHWSSGEPPALRIAGELIRLTDVLAIEADDLLLQVRDVLPSYVTVSDDARVELDCSFEYGQLGRFRLHIYRHAHGVAAALRVIPSVVPRLETLGLPSFIASLTKLQRGLVLVTGPTGSGKSTTLAALIDTINQDQARHIVTIEQPIEFRHRSKRSVVRQREVGAHTETFASALRAALREDPDLIMVGELRDLDTIQLALTAAETGHVVYATLHAAGGPKSIDRIIDVYPAHQQAQARVMLAESLQAVISQTLLTTANGARIPNVEILTGTPAVRTLIREAKTHQLQGLMQVSRAFGMCTFEMHRQELASF